MISDLSQKVDIRRKALPADFGFGEHTAVETSILNTWAKLTEIKRAHKLMQGLLAEVAHYKMTIRYRAGSSIQKDDIVVWQGKRLKAITNSTVIDIDKKKFLETIIILQDG
jgi:hypothetical protein